MDHPPNAVAQKKRISEGDMYLSADEQVDVNNLINGHESAYVFPRDDQLNYICVFQGCTKPILRGLGTDEYLTHLREHVTVSDRLLSNMLRRVVDEGDVRKRRRANSTNTYSLNMLPKKRELETKEEMYHIGSPESPSDSPPSTPRKRANSSDEYNIPLKPSSRGVQLRDQMLRYGLHLFRIDSEGKYICFFDECSLHMMTNFSRHIAKHEKNGDKIKQELLHLCSPNIIQQQLQQHPNLHMPHYPPNHPAPSQGPLQQLLHRHQQESIQLQQQQQQQQQLAAPHQLEQMQGFHSMQLQQLGFQHKLQLQMLQSNLQSPPSLQSPPQSPLHVHPGSPIPHMFQPEHMMLKQPPKQSVPELSLLSQVQNEADLALMRTQISKMLEESSSRRPLKQRSISLAYTSSSGSPTPHPLYLSPSPSPLHATPRTPPPYPYPHQQQQESIVLQQQLQQQQLRTLSPSESFSSPSISSTPTTTTTFSLPNSPPANPSLSTPSSSSSSASGNEIQWIFNKPQRPVLSK